MRIVLYILGVLFVIGMVAGMVYLFTPRGSAVATFEECVAAGNPIMESYPRQCRTPDGLIFVEQVAPGTPSGGITANGCAVAGCSGQLCISAEEAERGGGISTCEFRPEYVCYREASCEPQTDGKCGWTLTPELRQCLADPPALQ